MDQPPRPQRPPTIFTFSTLMSTWVVLPRQCHHLVLLTALALLFLTPHPSLTLPYRPLAPSLPFLAASPLRHLVPTFNLHRSSRRLTDFHRRIILTAATILSLAKRTPPVRYSKISIMPSRRLIAFFVSTAVLDTEKLPSPNTLVKRRCGGTASTPSTSPPLRRSSKRHR